MELSSVMFALSLAVCNDRQSNAIFMRSILFVVLFLKIQVTMVRINRTTFQTELRVNLIQFYFTDLSYSLKNIET